MSVDSLKRDRRRFGDALFRRVATVSGSGILVILAAVALFLIGLSLPALFASAEDLPYGPFWSWVIPLALGTVWAAALAMASSASSAVIGQTTRPSASAARSASSNCNSKAGSTPSAVL